jgi:hypothetical protein
MEKDVPPIIDAHAEVVHDPSAQTADQPDAFSELVQNLVSKALLIGIVVVAGLLWRWLYDLWFKIF